MKKITKTRIGVFRQNIIRFIVITLFNAISVAVCTGIGSLAPQMKRAVLLTPDNWYAEFLIDGIERISFIFPPFFMLTALLVIYITISRLIEVERPQMGCLVTLGYSKWQILSKYVYFITSSCLLGGIVGVAVGHYGVFPILYEAITSHVGLPKSNTVAPIFGIVSAIITVVFAVTLTLSTTLGHLSSAPADILKRKAPRAGRKIFLERINALWKRFPFRYKSSLRNVFRYKVRLFMTLFSMAFSTVLVFAGLALSFSLKQSDPELMDVIRPISSLISVLAVILNALVVYNTTNINIEERRGEIATLKVLGYKNVEVVGYVFREITILAFIGVLLGLPLGYIFIDFMFEFLRFGGIEYVKWYVWILTGALSMTSLALAFLLLFNKIHRVDMAESLKVL